MIRPVYALIDGALWLYWWVLVAYVVFSWVQSPPPGLVPAIRLVGSLVEPVVRPIRTVVPPLRIGVVALDLSVLIVFFGVWIIRLNLNN